MVWEVAFFNGVFGAMLGLLSTRGWSPVIFLALVELAWVSLCCKFAWQALIFNDVGLLYGALVVLVVSGAEFVVGVSSFVFYFHSRGSAM
jgi:hypothetical protein